ncbi:hypothetical protein AGABI2DRAFT_118474 [Agaricus bisporus var. bisporus H97]|uniref:hypothetical protein n=1 Tax=Agaricus bisporus var. bisporus (strain H97 / ATCC MYA-4626 / FGSC 10389) TaxID=936046 RepID=UPI00029F7AF4|nr:hypothetical protein AGABI2DRAFT_118474 [Agaricus bisporus var. bisporus H97]EKV46277.1 hypothetical protein AGABI2DRAFT_118474 [Agaricus bisporus var. bisporus H97]
MKLNHLPPTSSTNYNSMDEHHLSFLAADPACPSNQHWPKDEVWECDYLADKTIATTKQITKIVGEVDILNSALGSFGDYDDTYDMLENAQFRLNVREPVHFPQWQPLWSSSVERLAQHLHHTGSQFLLPLFSPTNDAIVFTHNIFQPRSTEGSHVINFDPNAYSDKQAAVVSQLMRTHNLTAMNIEHSPDRKPLGLEEFQTTLENSLVEIWFTIRHIVRYRASITPIQSFFGEMSNIRILARYQ